MNAESMGPITTAANSVHAEKYRAKGETFREAMNRIAAAVQDNHEHYMDFRNVLLSMRFMPAGRIQAAMGSLKTVTAYNCFVMGTIHDSFTDGPTAAEVASLPNGMFQPESIMDTAKMAAMTMRQGGGVGYDISTLRPSGDQIKGVQAITNGPLAFAPIYDAVCRATSSAGNRRGAQMLVLRADHPDIEAFIRAKHVADKNIPYEYRPLRGFNMSIAVDDTLMEAIDRQAPYMLKFGGRDYREVDSVDLWEMIMRSTYDWAEPGVLFIDQINRMNNLWYCETIAATNPCFAGNQTILTDQGPKTFAELEGQRVSVLTENQEGKLIYRPMGVFKTAKDQEILRVTLDDGTMIDCTHTHEFFDLDRNRVEARNLIPGQRLASVYRHNANSKGYKRLTNGIHKVVSVELLMERQDVFCGTVDETHRFFLGCERGGVLVSNCGEQPLPPYGACLLGSFNLVKYLILTNGVYSFDWDQFRKDIYSVVRSMDNVIDRTRYPLPQQKIEAKNKRRMGLGVTALANALEAMGHPYGEFSFLEMENKILSFLACHAYRASALLAKEKGSFPLYDAEKYMKGKFINGLDDETKALIKKYGIRNSHLTSIAPTGTISFSADNITSGIEPVLAYSQKRRVIMSEGPVIVELEDYGVSFLGIHGKEVDRVTPTEHINVLTTAQLHVDSAVSKTCNVPTDINWNAFKGIYLAAYLGGAKGCTTYRPAGNYDEVIKKINENSANTAHEKDFAEGEACGFDPVTGARTGNCAE